MARNLRAALTTTVAFAALGAGVISMAAPASADPSGFRRYVGVGSDTVQDVENAIAGDVTGITGATKLIGSYNAFPIKADGSDTTIVTRRGGTAFLRPAGSGAGVKALSDSMTSTPYNGVDITGYVDYARSSSGPAAGTGSQLTYIPFARDAVGYAYTGNPGRLGTLTTDQLRTLYSSNTPTKINGAVIKPLLPQASSGTRKFFLAAIGVTTLGSQVVETNGQENNGSLLTDVNEVIPFSAAQWISQKNGVVTDTTGTARLGSPDGVAPTKTQKATGDLIPNIPFFSSSYGRNVYNVIPTTEVGGTGVANMFVGQSSVFCRAAAQNIVVKYGFAKLGTLCGDTSTTGPLTP